MENLADAAATYQRFRKISSGMQRVRDVRHNAMKFHHKETHQDIFSRYRKNMGSYNALGWKAPLEVT